MRIEQLTAAVRPRSGWEAMDLGLRLLQQHASAVYRPWFLVLLPFTALLILACWVNPVWAGVALWWFKPLFGRLVLVVLGAAVFGTPPNTLSTLQQWWRLAWRDSWRLLTIGRFHPSRSFRLPVRQLERLKGGTRRKRLNTLSDGSSTGALWFATILIDWVIALLLISLTFLLFGNWLEHSNLQWESDDRIFGASIIYIWFGTVPFIEHWQMQLLVFLYALRISIVEPFFAAAGFGLYLNRRTVLEGWDIELKFRRIAARLAAIGKASIAIILVATLSLATPSKAYAETSTTAEEATGQEHTVVKRSEADKCAEFSTDVKRLVASNNEASQALAELLTTDDWKPCEMSTFRRWNNEKEDWDTDDSDWGFEFPLIGTLLKPLIWALVIGGTLLLLLQAWRWRDSLAAGSLPGRERKTETHRSKITLQHEIIGSVLHNAQALWLAGQHREAMSLLYRGALQKLDARWQLELEDSYTESECLQAINSRSQAESLPELSHWFSRLTLNWQRIAWGHRPPNDQEFSELKNGWKQHIEYTDGGPKND